jgi:hypothetical protein
LGENFFYNFIFHKTYNLSTCEVNFYRLRIELYGKGKGKVHPITGHEGPEGE